MRKEEGCVVRPLGAVKMAKRFIYSKHTTGKRLDMMWSGTRTLHLCRAGINETIHLAGNLVIITVRISSNAGSLAVSELHASLFMRLFLRDIPIFPKIRWGGNESVMMSVWGNLRWKQGLLQPQGVERGGEVNNNNKKQTCA
ncbi:hypothetical protein TRVL_05230 [Trypanosoma vivax]|nr:hypothetical protein TRVL_05230 [Trypanosoma vivax]